MPLSRRTPTSPRIRIVRFTEPCRRLRHHRAPQVGGHLPPPVETLRGELAPTLGHHWSRRCHARRRPGRRSLSEPRRHALLASRCDRSARRSGSPAHAEPDSSTRPARPSTPKVADEPHERRLRGRVPRRTLCTPHVMYPAENLDVLAQPPVSAFSALISAARWPRSAPSWGGCRCGRLAESRSSGHGSSRHLSAGLIAQRRAETPLNPQSPSRPTEATQGPCFEQTGSLEGMLARQ